jgi:hypothetical protein
MRTSLALVVILAVIPALVLCTDGFDLSYFQGRLGESTFTCLKNSGYTFGPFPHCGCHGSGLLIIFLRLNRRHSSSN